MIASVKKVFKNTECLENLNKIKQLFQFNPQSIRNQVGIADGSIDHAPFDPADYRNIKTAVFRNFCLRKFFAKPYLFCMVSELYQKCFPTFLVMPKSANRKLKSYRRIILLLNFNKT